MKRSLQKNGFKVGLFERAVAFANRIAALPNRLTPPPFRLIQIGSAYWLSRALYVAARLKIADELAAGAQHCTSLATRLALDEENLYRLLRMLAANGIFQETEHRTFCNSKLSEPLRRDHPQSVRSMLLLHNSPQLVQPWVNGLEDAVRRGSVPFVQEHGEELFAYLDHHPEFDTLFSSAMDEVEAITGLDYLDDFDWSRFARLIDVGGAYGSKSLTLLRHHPHLTALVLDRPQVAAAARQHWEEQGITTPLERMEFIGGDMLESLPPSRDERDIYLFIAVFHGLADKVALQLLANIREAISETGATAVIADTVAGECRIDPTVAGFDMQMLVSTYGRERSEREWRELVQQAQLEIREIVSVRTFAKLIVITPP